MKPSLLLLAALSSCGPSEKEMNAQKRAQFEADRNALQAEYIGKANSAMLSLRQGLAYMPDDCASELENNRRDLATNDGINMDCYDQVERPDGTRVSMQRTIRMITDQPWGHPPQKCLVTLESDDYAYRFNMDGTRMVNGQMDQGTMTIKRQNDDNKWVTVDGIYVDPYNQSSMWTSDGMRIETRPLSYFTSVFAKLLHNACYVSSNSYESIQAKDQYAKDIQLLMPVIERAFAEFNREDCKEKINIGLLDNSWGETSGQCDWSYSDREDAIQFQLNWEVSGAPEEGIYLESMTMKLTIEGRTYEFENYDKIGQLYSSRGIYVKRILGVDEYQRIIATLVGGETRTLQQIDTETHTAGFSRYGVLNEEERRIMMLSLRRAFPEQQRFIIMPDRHLSPYVSSELNAPAQVYQAFHYKRLKELAREDGELEIIKEGMRVKPGDIKSRVVDVVELPTGEFTGSTRVALEDPDIKVNGATSDTALSNTSFLLSHIYDAASLVKDGDQYLCPSQSNLSIADAHDRLLENPTDQLAIDCYCSAWDYTGDAFQGFAYDRGFQAPRTEVGAALMSYADTVVVVQGSNHVPEAVLALSHEGIVPEIMLPAGEPTPTVADFGHPLPDVNRVCIDHKNDKGGVSLY